MLTCTSSVNVTPNLRPRSVIEPLACDGGGDHETRHSESSGPPYRTSDTSGAASDVVGSRSSLISTSLTPSTSPTLLRSRSAKSSVISFIAGPLKSP